MKTELMLWGQVALKVVPCLVLETPMCTLTNPHSVPHKSCLHLTVDAGFYKKSQNFLTQTMDIMLNNK